MFRFKQFAIKQERAAMKVCTDSCLFGSLIATENKKNALDIGCGTGLLSLMVAQKNQKIQITALEIDQNAVLDATENIQESPFANQITLHHQTVQDFAKKSDNKFDLIFCNPPFYQNNLKSDKIDKNIAHHAETLTFNDLAKCIDILLEENGSAWILLPPFEMREFISLVEERKLYVSKRYEIRHDENKPVFRVIIELKRAKAVLEEISLINIYENKQYSPIFAELLRDYYLIF
ncbi:methyltransferase domain-containing protein [Lacihabitans sp. CCS-44]|uniref:tRNA1(Val) (adenine(37)-N6)-methyltransferase n=1 Tax=Lacihabitans sp. CCS-44 TaxID=2487331 RepID=UPI0020CC9712|nr:methyltransferase [Lacihabitans sp. CCS-44]MCP9753581.1 methyltransferase domain-containing protein [Lacihabitans sp. CCS-44]